LARKFALDAARAGPPGGRGSRPRLTVSRSGSIWPPAAVRTVPGWLSDPVASRAAARRHSTCSGDHPGNVGSALGPGGPLEPGPALDRSAAGG